MSEGAATSWRLSGNPSDHVALIARDTVATLLVARSPFSQKDIERLTEVSDRYEFRRLIFPGEPTEDLLLRRIMASRTLEVLDRATAHPLYDYTAPRDERPFFFNMLKLASFYRFDELERSDVLQHGGGVIWGNIGATYTLGLLFLIATVLTILIIGGPLLVSGLPAMPSGSFIRSAGYFAAIGFGFMSIQIPLLQRFSVYLRHPIYTYSVILFTMILAAGIGSLLSDRLERLERWTLVIPLVISANIVALSLGLQPILDATRGGSVWVRIAVVTQMTAPLSLSLGCCFPMGMRLVDARSPAATAWMWGLNGAAGVLASIVAVAISMWGGIHANFIVAAVCYASLALVSRRLKVEPAV